MVAVAEVTNATGMNDPRPIRHAAGRHDQLMTEEQGKAEQARDQQGAPEPTIQPSCDRQPSHR
jgi:hypothetical protein